MSRWWMACRFWPYPKGAPVGVKFHTWSSRSVWTVSTIMHVYCLTPSPTNLTTLLLDDFFDKSLSCARNLPCQLFVCLGRGAVLSWDGTAQSNWLYHQELMTEQHASFDSCNLPRTVHPCFVASTRTNKLTTFSKMDKARLRGLWGGCRCVQ